MKRISWLLLIPVLMLGLFPASQAQAQAPPRRGWSPQAKDAAIGGAAGILGGILVNGRNRKVGALIGGLAGTGVGYAVGKHTDNKRKAAAAVAAQQAAAREQAAAEAQAAASQRDAATQRTTAAQASARAADERVATARANAARTSTARAAADRRLAAEHRAEASQAQGAAPAVADLAVAAGFFSNPNYDQTGYPYSFSEVRRKSW
ncbi:glycine zipper domain-containing protein [Hymenobacter psoromatis]|uniref:glycine zipper domain-containing protein n=1 Tax=Hymenobacter psoromatis TaxID=1484116 RepID=UPI001CBF3E48|nr:glycine zipper domain-containing protein [Hymenobacter psoromatis]